MIHNLLPTVAGELNDYFKSRFDLNEDRVVISNLMNQDGTVAVEGMNKVVCYLANIEEETTLKATKGTKAMGGGYGSTGGDININLTVMFSSFFTGKNYVEALKFISGVIYFFQSKPVFNTSNTPGLTDNIDKAVFDIISMNPRDLNAMFSMMGMKYVPTVIYRVRMLTFSSMDIDDEIPSITGIGLESGRKEDQSPSKRFGRGDRDGLGDFIK